VEKFIVLAKEKKILWTVQKSRREIDKIFNAR
jgi:hypothetical protein